jgi:hypothetical protein
MQHRNNVGPFSSPLVPIASLDTRHFCLFFSYHAFVPVLYRYATLRYATLLLLLHSLSLQVHSTAMTSTNNDNNTYLRHLTESDMAQMISGDAGAGGTVNATNATTTFQEDSSGTATATATAMAFHHTMESDDNDGDDRILPHPLPKQKTAESSPELEAMIRGLRQDLDGVIQVNKVETDRMFDEMVIFLEDSQAICTDTMLGHLDFETREANRLTGMEPDVDAATVSLVGIHHQHGHHNM